jgi:hypothetical protein
VGSTGAWANPVTRLAELASEVDRIVSRHVGADTPGVAVLVGTRGRVLVNKGYGLADVEKRVPVTAGTRFLIGSVSKALTAMAGMLLRSADSSPTSQRARTRTAAPLEPIPGRRDWYWRWTSRHGAWWSAKAPQYCGQGKALLPLSRDRFAPDGRPDVALEFRRNQTGHVARLHVDANGNVYELIRTVSGDRAEGRG